MIKPRRAVLKLLDRPGGRWLLAAGARQISGASIGFDGYWYRKLADGLVVVDQKSFPYFREMLVNTGREIRQLEDAARDYWFFDYQPSPGHIIVDVGAGSGTDTRVFSDAVGSSGCVYSIEAHPDTYHRLRMATTMNAWHNVVPIHAAIIGDDEQVVFIENDSFDLSNAVSLNPSDQFAIPVAGIGLDRLLERENINRIDFLKMNIEGAERLALDGMRKAMSITSHIAIACHDFLGDRNDWYRTRSIVTAYLQEHGFQIRTREDDHRGYVRDHVHGKRL